MTKTTKNAKIARYEHHSVIGINGYKDFKYNFGLNKLTFGSWTDGSCYHGINQLILYDLKGS